MVALVWSTHTFMLLWVGLRKNVARKSRPFVSRLYSSHLSTKNSSNHNLITSPQSKTIKTIQALLSKRKRRYELGETVAEGPRMVLDLLKNPQTRHLVQQVIISEAEWDEYYPLIRQRDTDDAWLQVLPATSEVLNACTDTVTNQGIIARVRIPTQQDQVRLQRSSTTDDNHHSRHHLHPFYVIVDGVQDPGNMGTLIRSSVATGVTEMFVLPHSADVWSPKALRSAMGTTFLLPIRSLSSFGECIDALQQQESACRRIWAATMLSNEFAAPSSISHYNVNWIQEPTAVVIGSEGIGLSDEVRRALVELPHLVQAVHVPMLAGVESLNAAVCGSVILFEYQRQCQMVANNESYKTDTVG